MTPRVGITGLEDARAALLIVEETYRQSGRALAATPAAAVRAE
jgi:hypothetical protein